MVEKALRLCEGSARYAAHLRRRNLLAAAVQGEALALPDAGQGPSRLFRRFVDGEQIVTSPMCLTAPSTRVQFDGAAGDGCRQGAESEGKRPVIPTQGGQ